MANNFRMEQDTVSGRSVLKTADIRLSGNVIFCTLAPNEKVIDQSFDSPFIKFFKRPWDPWDIAPTEF